MRPSTSIEVELRELHCLGAPVFRTLAALRSPSSSFKLVSSSRSSVVLSPRSSRAPEKLDEEKREREKERQSKGLLCLECFLDAVHLRSRFFLRMKPSLLYYSGPRALSVLFCFSLESASKRGEEDQEGKTCGRQGLRQMVIIFCRGWEVRSPCLSLIFSLFTAKGKLECNCQICVQLNETKARMTNWKTERRSAAREKGVRSDFSFFPRRARKRVRDVRGNLPFNSAAAKKTSPPHRLAASFTFKEIAAAREVQTCLSRTVGFEKKQRA